jgi:hypothetical protein
VKTQIRLSSIATFFSKFILPVAFLLLLPIWFQRAIRSGVEAWLVAGLWLAACMFLIASARRLHRVTIQGDSFVISNYLRTCHVPIGHLRRITEHRWDKAQSITLHFAPSTPFGDRVRIIPRSFRSREIAELLNSMTRPHEAQSV